MAGTRLAAAAGLLVAAWAIVVVQPAAALYGAGGPVVELTESNFKSKIKGGGVWMVEFYAPWCGHCKALQPAWEQAAKALKGIVNVGAVDADQHKSLGGEYGIKGFPTIKLMYADDSGSIKSVDFNGGRAAKDIINFALDKAKALALKRIGEKASAGGGGGGGGSKGAGGGGGGGGDGGFYAGTDVATLTEDDFAELVVQSEELWLVEFYAPWCGHCKSLKPVWIEAAGELKGKLNMGAVDCTVHQGVCGNYGVQGYPTIKFFGANKKKPEDYQGGRDLGSIKAFANSKWSAMVPAPEPVELTSQEVFEKECLGSSETGAKPKRRCLIAFLPDLLDSKASGRRNYISVLKKTAEAFKGSPFSYLWVAGGKQPQLEANFDVGGFGYPALVALYPSEKMYSVCKGAFAAGPVKEWVEAMRTTGGGAAPLHGPLAAVSALPAWDGQDAKEEAVDEFSLEDLMGEDL